MIKFLNVLLFCGCKMLLEEVLVQVFLGYKVVLIGSNGCGKFMFFVLLRSELSVDVGDCSVLNDW